MMSLLESSSVLYVVGSVLLVILLLWLSVTVYFYLLHRRYAHIPGPKIPSFYMGHLPTIAAAMKKGKLYEQVVLEWGQQYGPLIVFFMFYQAMVVPFNSKDVKEVLMNVKLPKAHFLYSKVQKTFSERFLGGGLLAAYDYDSWKPRRSLYDPSFTRGYLKTLVPSFNKGVDSFLADLRTVADGNTKVLMKKHFKAITLHIIGQVAFGSDFSSTCTWSDEALGLKHVKGDGTLNFLIDHALRGVELSYDDPFYYIFHPYEVEGYREAIRAIRKIGQECIEKRFKAIANEEEVPNDILTQIVRVAQSDKGIQLDDLMDDFATFYIAGQETTAMLLTFTLIELCQHPDVQQRVLEEISEVLGDRDYVTQEDIDQLKYMEQVFQEVMRLYPPVTGTGRDVVTDDFKLCGYPIPKGAMIAIDYYSNHHNPDIWEDPETFDPSRFSPDREKPDPFIYSPFSIGHRSCIGKVFAMMEAKIILARLLNSFKIDLEEGYQLKVEEASTLRPTDDVPCTVVPLK